MCFISLFVVVSTKKTFIKNPRRRLETGQGARCREAVSSLFCAVLAASQPRPWVSVKQDFCSNGEQNGE